MSEPLFRFWFRFVYGQEGKIVQLGETAYEQLVAPEFTDYMGALFESACQRALPRLVPKTYHGIGYWWHKQHELDVVGLADDGTIVAGECKYTSRHMTEGDLARLERTAATIEWTPPDDSDPTYHYCCFCRSGFSEDLKQLAEGCDAVTLFTPDEIVAGLTTSHQK